MNDDLYDQWLPGNGELQKTSLIHPSGAHAEIYRHGAHLTAWQSAAGNDWIFTSGNARFDSRSAIRGGVPIIFPQFNEFGNGQRHGFARNLDWQTSERSDNQITMFLESNDATKMWPHQFRAEFNSVVESSALSMTLSITNTSAEVFQFTCALHTYFKIHSLPTCRVTGLTGLEYWDNDGADFKQRHVFEEQQLVFSDAFDRVFFNYQRPLILHSNNEQLKIEHTGFQDVVVWNPGREAAQAMSDFGDHEFNHMICIEAAQVDHPVLLPPGETWIGRQLCTDLAFVE